MTTALAGATLAALLLAGACGDDEPRLTAAEYRAQADEICRQTSAELRQIPDPVGPEDILPTFERAAPLTSAQLEDLRALNPPEELEQAHDDATAALDEQVSLTEDAIERLKDGEPAVDVVNDVVARLDELDRRADELALQLGLRVCGEASDEAADPRRSNATGPGVAI
jgi:hypothetical protein